jgi:hypothetical protein
MNKTKLSIFCLLSIFALTFAGTVSAYNADYTHTNYSSTVKPTADGTYILDDEWVASAAENFGTNAMFSDEWTTAAGTWACLLIETEDGTNDAEDQWVICFDSTEAGMQTEPNGGTAPQTDDYKLVITGHGAGATVEWFKGTGTAWAAATTTPNSTVFEQAQSLTTTPRIAEDHYVLEVCIDKQDTTMGTAVMGFNWAQFVSYYDASEQDLQQWPPADATPAGSPDVPDSWGYIVYDTNPNPTPDIPETTSFIVMAAVSCVAVAGALLLRKRK